MDKVRIWVAVAAALALAAVAASAAFAASSLFTASYTGRVTERVDGQTVYAAATGTGTGNLVGRSSIRGNVVGNTSNPPCAPFGGPGSIKSAKGVLKLKILRSSSRGCGSEDNQTSISISGNATAVGGTGKFRRAKGTVHFSGRYNRTAHTFTMKLRGRLTF